MIAPCTCVSPYQDRIYGKGMRVWNKTTKVDGRRCTVCGKEEGSGSKKK